MAIKNGGRFLKQQIDSILPQLAVEDELIISDDHSTDDSVAIIAAIPDPRIRILKNHSFGLTSNFENCLRASKGEIIFLADQDDIWTSDKIQQMLPYFQRFELVVSDCFIVKEGSLNHESFFEQNGSRKGLIRNICRNSYMGCCMAFKREVLERALPIPKNLPVHDVWIGLIAELHFKVVFIHDKLVYHRRHEANASSTSSPSNASLLQKMNLRYQLAKNLIRLSYA
jgi:glycosyltransferase involved in cell wall biosynthesis